MMAFLASPDVEPAVTELASAMKAATTDRFREVESATANSVVLSNRRR